MRPVVGKKKRQREAPVVAGAKQLFRMHATAGRLVWKRVNTAGVIRTVRGRTFMTKNHDQDGISDFLVWIYQGPMLCLEAKAPGGRLEDSQREFEAQLRRIGHPYYLFRSLDELEEILAKYGVPRLTLVPFTDTPHPSN